MSFFQNIFSNLYISSRWYGLLLLTSVLFLGAYFFEFLFWPSFFFFGLIILLTIIDFSFLFILRGRLIAHRILPAKMSLGDENEVQIKINNQFPFSIWLRIIDELPEQFQKRDFLLKTKIKYSSNEHLQYTLCPKSRGLYEFGRLLCFIESPIRFLQRRMIAEGTETVKVYPSFLRLKKYQLMALGENSQAGDKKMRRVGNSLEFEKIKDYVLGDDIRNINWKATARRGGLMTNMYTDARQQQIYCVIDKGRTMKMPFDGLSLLDYAINASLAVLNIALLKQDKAGLITFSKSEIEIIPADKRNNQFFHIQEALYQQKTEFKESDFNSLRSNLQRKVGQRSLLLFFTNFETMAALERQLPHLKLLARQHLLCVVFFENTMIKQLHENEAQSIKDIYVKTIAERFDFEKKQIVKELRRHGILSILSTPKNLSIDVINKYLELKTRQML
ncbi:MAG: DUF58 domain-containing protein [Bacteroidota bacterium]